MSSNTWNIDYDGVNCLKTIFRNEIFVCGRVCTLCSGRTSTYAHIVCVYATQFLGLYYIWLVSLLYIYNNYIHTLHLGDFICIHIQLTNACVWGSNVFIEWLHASEYYVEMGGCAVVDRVQYIYVYFELQLYFVRAIQTRQK